MEKEFAIIAFVYAILDMILLPTVELRWYAILDALLLSALVQLPLIVKFILFYNNLIN